MWEIMKVIFSWFECESTAFAALVTDSVCEAEVNNVLFATVVTVWKWPTSVLTPYLQSDLLVFSPPTSCVFPECCEASTLRSLLLKIISVPKSNHLALVNEWISKPGVLLVPPPSPPPSAHLLAPFPLPLPPSILCFEILIFKETY